MANVRRSRTEIPQYSLHIWGPAFGLPSIEAECIAAALYLQSILAPAQWMLLIDHDTSSSSNGDFPLLIDHSHPKQPIAGFDAIAAHFKKPHSNVASSSQVTLGPLARAQTIALASHIRANALPLLDATFYATSSHWRDTTRPAWTKILPTHLNYIIPPGRYEAALRRSATLGLESAQLDGDAASVHTTASDHGNPASQEARMISSNSPSLVFPGRRQKLTQALRIHQTQARFRMEGLLEELVDSILECLSETGNRYLLSENRPTSIDFLAFGYLSLLTSAPLRDSWICDWILSRKLHGRFSEAGGVPSIQTWLRQMSELFGADSIDVKQVIESASEVDGLRRTGEHGLQPKGTVFLPWSIREPPSYRDSVKTMCWHSVRSLLAYLPLFNPHFAALPTEISEPWTLSSKTMVAAGISSCIGLISLLAHLATKVQGDRDKYFGPPRARLFSFGAAGEALAAL